MTEDLTSSAPLRGIRVLELGSAILGPYTSQQLAEYGASVIKVEPPEGDLTRQMGPARERGMAALFLANNRGKRSIVLNLKDVRGREAFSRLVAHSDVVIHNMRPKKAGQIGLDPDILLEKHPTLVVAALTGFLSGGPYADDPAYDDIIQALSGLMGLSQAAGGQPAYVPSAVADKTTSNVAVQAILAALFQRERTGKGGVVEVPMFETMASYVLLEHAAGHHFEPPAGPIGYSRYLAPSHRAMRTSDGALALRPMTDAHWKSLFMALGDQEAASDQRFCSFATRAANIDAAFERLELGTMKLTTSECLERARRLDVPAARINSLTDLMQDPHLTAVGHFDRIEDAAMGTLVFASHGPRFSGAKQRLGLAPRLGQHTREILREASFDDEEVSALVSSGAALEAAGFPPQP